MFIGIDGNEANQKIRAGSGVYAYNILWEIFNQSQKLKVKSQKDNLKFKIYLKERPLVDLPPATSFWQYQVVKPKQFWTQLGAPLRLWREKLFYGSPDIFFTPAHYAPRFCPIPVIITIYDLSFIRYPEMFIKKDLYQLKRWTSYSVKQAKKIITISEFSRREILNHYSLSADKVAVCYPGYGKERFNFRIKNQESRIKKIRQKLKIEGEYLLFVGTIQPRKNLARLIEAFGRLKTSTPDLKLLICGMMKEGRGGWMQEEILRKIRNSKCEIQNNTIITGYVYDSDLPYLLADAKAFVLPSLYEGFGIPALEAMAAGVPVVVSKTSSLPEVCKDAAIYIEDPYSVDSIVFAVNRVLALNRKERENLIKLGLSQAKKFSWDKTGEKILQIFLEFGNKYI
ncbi:glycosyltransferase family 4 protein [Candidatus Gottesmanbacteria bacterium]|nr:glycosyltransferase family 4 protein [Candidatus Gottesmanbacteria bacterium]